VFVILGLIGASAAPKLIDLSNDATAAKLETVEKSFKAGVNLAHTKWRVLGSPSDNSSRNDIQLYGTTTNGQVDINAYGWPAQSNSASSFILMNNDTDC
jgi:hypothetical protein